MILPNRRNYRCSLPRRGYTTKPRVALRAPWVNKMGQPHMQQSLVQIYLHIIFSTKNRARLFRDRAFREKLHAYLAGVCRNLGSATLIVGGVEDHVHILCRQGKTISVSDLIREMKRDSSKWVKQESPDLPSFYWQQGYGAFSISPSHLDAINAYIANQDEHHKTDTYQDEFRQLLAEYEIEYDERYVRD